jgi:plasmid stabilization system protein ParE
MRLRFHRLARAEYVEAIAFLERRRDGYGEKFEAEVGATLQRIRDFPQSGALVPGYPPNVELRQYPLRVFPYSLMVGFEGNEAVVYAVAHQHRKPGYWHRRLRR